MARADQSEVRFQHDGLAHWAEVLASQLWVQPVAVAVQQLTVALSGIVARAQ